MIDEKTHMWYILSDRYGDMAWEMLEDMKGEEFCHKKVSRYLTFIMNNWPDEEVCITVRTWTLNSEFIILELNEDLKNKFFDKYTDYIVRGGYTKLAKTSWSKPSQNP
jgi:hypothetical protein